MIRKGVRYEYCNGRAGGNKKLSRTGKSFAAGINDKKKR